MKFQIMDQYPAIRHIVTEKKSGIGYDFSMALHTGEDKKQIRANRAILEEYFGEEYLFCGIRQTHSDIVYLLESSENQGWGSLSSAVEADAVVTNLPKMVLTVLTADCVPILLYDPVQSAIGAVHAGWKGTRNHIVTKTILRMKEAYGSRAEDLIVGIGPAIGKCCYEVGEEVSRYFMHHTHAVVQAETMGKYLLDLKHVNKNLLLEAGVKRENIEVSPLCTACNNDRFFSYRKEQECSGRFISAIGFVRSYGSLDIV